MSLNKSDWLKLSLDRKIKWILLDLMRCMWTVYVKCQFLSYAIKLFKDYKFIYKWQHQNRLLTRWVWLGSKPLTSTFKKLRVQFESYSIPNHKILQQLEEK